MELLNGFFLISPLGDQILLEFAHESLLLGASLETSVTELRAGVNPLEVYLLEGKALGLVDETLAQSDRTLLRADATPTDHHEVLVDHPVVREAAHRVNVLAGDVELGGAILFADVGETRFSQAVNLLVDLGSVVVTLLTRASNSELNARWMPGSGTGDLS